MNPGVQIAYRHIDPSAALSACIEDEFERLSKLCHPVGCRVTVEPNPQVEGPQLRVRVEVELRGKTLVADRAPPPDGETDPYLEVRQAFRVVRRQLGKYVEHQSPRTGPRVADLAPGRGRRGAR